MKRNLFIVAVTGWVLSLIVHLTALIGNYDLTEALPPLLLLHIGIFIVWWPTVGVLRRELRRWPVGAEVHLSTSFENSIGKISKWLVAIAIAGVFYAFVNMWQFIVSDEGSPDIKDGQYVLRNRVHIIRILSESEYTRIRAHRICLFSSGWLMLYSLAAAAIFPSGKKDRLAK